MFSKFYFIGNFSCLFIECHSNEKYTKDHRPVLLITLFLTERRLFKKLSIILFSLLLINCGGGGGGADSPTPAPEPTTAPQPAPPPSMNSVSFLSSNNNSLDNDVSLVIEEDLITGRITSNVRVDNLIATYDYEGVSVKIDGVTQQSGISENDFTQVTTLLVENADGDTRSYQLDLTKFTGLPIVYLTTENNVEVESKEDYINGTVEIDGGRFFDDMPVSEIRIRGRGNSTWFLHPKKPYQIRFEEKTEFLGMIEDKRWLFLAEYSDKTLLRNKTVFEMGYISNFDYTTQGVYAEVYLNGLYNGTYNITQKVEESNNRVAVGDEGYLLEIDQDWRLDDDDVFFYTDQFLVNVKEPAIAYDTPEYDYIREYINQFEDALFGELFTSDNFGYKNYIDVPSWIDWFIINEIVKNVDSRNFASIFFSVIPGEKIKKGPLWDFDLSFGNTDYADSQYSDGWWVKYNPWYERLFEDPEFVQLVKDRFSYYKQNQQFILDKVDEFAAHLVWAQVENNDKWQTMGQYVWPNAVVLETYEEEVAHLKNWYIERMDWLETALDDL